MEKSNLTKKHFEILNYYSLNEAQLEDCSVLTYDKGEPVFLTGNVNDRLIIVSSGRAKVLGAANNGKNLVISYYASSGLMGDMEMMSDSKRASATVIALSNFECICIPYRNNIDKLRTNNQFMNKLAQSLANKLVNSSNDFVATTLHTGEQRLCSYIAAKETNGFFKDNLSNVSETIGLSYRHLFRLLNRLCLEGILKKQSGGYSINKYEELMLRSSEI